MRTRGRRATPAPAPRAAARRLRGPTAACAASRRIELDFTQHGVDRVLGFGRERPRGVGALLDRRGDIRLDRAFVEQRILWNMTATWRRDRRAEAAAEAVPLGRQQPQEVCRKTVLPLPLRRAGRRIRPRAAPGKPVQHAPPPSVTETSLNSNRTAAWWMRILNPDRSIVVNPFHYPDAHQKSNPHECRTNGAGSTGREVSGQYCLNWVTCRTGSTIRSGRLLRNPMALRSWMYCWPGWASWSSV